jgi:TDG/mug DNA glycosylase family protein
VAADLEVLFCGINPGLLSAASGLHFARPGNRFWKVIHAAGFTARLLEPSEQIELLDAGLGITNLVERGSAAASELTAAELRTGADRLAREVEAWRPAHVAVLGVQAYRTAFRRPKAVVGEQPEALAGARLWVLPNPSGLQARYQLAEMTGLYSVLARAAGFAATDRAPGEPGRKETADRARAGDRTLSLSGDRAEALEIG